MRFSRFVWLLPALILSLGAWRLAAADLAPAVVLVPLALAWLTTLVRIWPAAARALAWLHRWPALFWLLWLLSASAVVGGWLLIFQPDAGVWLRPREVYYGLACGYWLLCFFSTGLTRQALAAMGQRLGWRAGPLVTLTTLVLILFGVELGLRYAVVMSDNFKFSRMHRNWERLYWQPINAYDYRDHPPADPAARNVLVVGDSFVAGYGVNDIGQTFPHLLDEQLGPQTAVNIVAAPGWGVALGMSKVEAYPVAPDVLVLSHYTNDIVESRAGQRYTATFPDIRIEPPPGLAYWVEQTAIGNFWYYRLYHYAAHDAFGQYLRFTLDAYHIPEVWGAYTSDDLQIPLRYADQHDVPLVVIVWGNLADLAATRAETQLVVDFFRSAGVPVVDMTEVLADEPPGALVVNPFDAHPSVYAHQQAAAALAAVLAE